jgi:hypothetical protein
MHRCSDGQDYSSDYGENDQQCISWRAVGHAKAIAHATVSAVEDELSSAGRSTAPTV